MDMVVEDEHPAGDKVVFKKEEKGTSVAGDERNALGDVIMVDVHQTNFGDGDAEVEIV